MYTGSLRMPNSPTPPDRITLTATVDNVIFRSDDSRYAVVRTERDERQTEPIVIVGDLGAVAPGETLRVTGRWRQHPTYGRRFQAEAFTPITPESRQGIARYLGSGLVPGVGSELAERLTERFGEQTLEVIANQTARLREVEGIGRRRSKAIAQAVRERMHEAETLSYLHGLGLGPALSHKILQRYGSDAVRIMRDDPYLVAEEIAGVGFKTADAIGRAVGYEHDDPRRAAGAILHLVGRSADEGHVFAARGELIEQARELQVPEEIAHGAIETLTGRGMLVVDHDSVYAPPLHRAETSVAREIARLSASPAAALPKQVHRILQQGASARVSEAQREAVRGTLEGGVMVLTGGPGTGKTTTVKAIVQAHRSLERRVQLCAPTGRAAKRLHEATGHRAATIHRLLDFDPQSNSFQRNAARPLKADLVLVDEASMLDVVLADKLLSALPHHATLVLVGDVEQLPPVNPGAVLREIIDSGCCRVVRLDEVFRQAQKSAIVRGAHAILAGELPTPTEAGTRGEGDLFMIRASDADTTHQKLIDTLRRIPAAYGLDIQRDVQVLTPMRKGPLGTEGLNQLLQAELNPGHPPGPKTRFFPGDKIMQLRNDYEREVFNGDLGEVTKIDAGIVYARMGEREVTYEPDAQDALTLAYASTIHKSQGSEFPAVVLLMHMRHYVLLSRALLYTAVTRAKKLVVIIGEPRALKRALDNSDALATNSHLAARLRQAKHA